MPRKNSIKPAKSAKGTKITNKNGVAEAARKKFVEINFLNDPFLAISLESKKTAKEEKGTWKTINNKRNNILETSSTKDGISTVKVKIVLSAMESALKKKKKRTTILIGL